MVSFGVKVWVNHIVILSNEIFCFWIARRAQRSGEYIQDMFFFVAVRN